ncbi:fungal-specific transcription factor domain-containing protein [Leptodontidium sp. 2 PMI_412]|nr:fungal-specific transcription factor domain-containing protein [Leptodontidium sp. 2 PMI_412]
MGKIRIRTVEGSCWSCQKRRIKCDLTKPRCTRCTKVGAECDFNSQRLNWSTRPTPKAPAIYQLRNREEQLTSALASDEKRALSYFHGRLWPLLSTTRQPCAAPILEALEHRVVLLATCVFADAHRVLQDGRNSRSLLRTKRLECLETLRGGVGSALLIDTDRDTEIGAVNKNYLMTLLLAVLLLYFNDGLLDCAHPSASTSSHHSGVRAIIDSLGGIDAVLETSHESLHMLLSDFISMDLTSVMLRGGEPSFPPEIWETVDKKSVWWSKDVLGRSSLATVLQQTSRLAWYRNSIDTGREQLSMETIRDFETALSPMYARIADTCLENFSTAADPEVDQTFNLIRTFQHSALIYMYRAICGLPVSHSLVQQHVLPCLECIFDIKQPSRVLNCTIFPLLVAGAHVQSPRHQRSVSGLVCRIRNEVRFASFYSVGEILSAIWRANEDEVSWFDMFSQLGPDAIVL